VAAHIPRLNVLVVEDDPSMRELLRLHLSNAGYVVTVAEDAVVAGHCVFKYTPDLIVLDVELPYMDGLEFAANLQSDTTLPHIPIVFITAHEDFAPRAELLGADFIVKPFPRDRLLQSVATAIRRPPNGRQAAGLVAHL
jgi:two-component system OmpR family response regulator